MALKGENKVTPKQFKEITEKFLKDCKDNNTVPLLAKYEYLLGISDKTLASYRLKPEYASTIKRVEKAQEIALLEKGINENKPVFPIFLLKSKHNYQESSKLDLTSNGQTLGVVQLPQKGA